MSDCTICKYLDPNSAAMGKHVRLMHPERCEKILETCSFCGCYYEKGAEMENHLRLVHPIARKRYYYHFYLIVRVYRYSKKRTINYVGSKKNTMGWKGIVYLILQSLKSTDIWKKVFTSFKWKNKRCLFRKCTFCTSIFEIGSQMENHVRSRHPTGQRWNYLIGPTSIVYGSQDKRVNYEKLTIHCRISFWIR